MSRPPRAGRDRSDSDPFSAALRPPPDETPEQREHRLRAELAWHEELAAALPDVTADERARALAPEPLPTDLPGDHVPGDRTKDSSDD